MLKTENGRSMVEMLGVLAIIGVLSVGGITGYRYAMEKYKINNFVNQLSLLLIDLESQVKMGNEDLKLNSNLDVSGWDIQLINPTFDAYFSSDFGIVISKKDANWTEEECYSVLASQNDILSGIYIGEGGLGFPPQAAEGISYKTWCNAAIKASPNMNLQMYF